MAKLKKAEIKKIEKKQREVLFYGTPELGYTDSGLWEFLKYVYTKDAIDLKKPIKRLLGEGDIYAIVVFLYMLVDESVLIPKSRQVRMSWISCTFALWVAMGGPVRHVIYQTKKEEDAFDQTTKGRDNPGEGRMDFILQRLPSWLRDPHVVSGKGNSQGSLRFSPHPMSPEGVKIPWAGSKITAIPQGAKQVRQHTPTLYFNDESAFQAEYRASIIAASACAKKMVSVSSVDAGSFVNQAVLNFPSHWETDERGSPGHREIHPVVKHGLDLMGIKWPKGMISYKTNAGTWVLEVSYKADPKKDPERDGAEWYKKAVLKDGYEGRYDSEGWATEMEVNYKAGGGHPVFPQVRISTPIFIDAFKPQEIMHDHRFFAGYDFGGTNPSAFEVIAVNERGQRFAVWEEYGPCLNMARHVEDMKRCPYWDLIEMIVGDPSIMSKTQHGAADTRTLAELFEDFGFILERGRRGQDVTMAQKFNASYWVDPESPDFFITKACPNLAREVMGLRWDKHISEAVDARKNALERIRDKDNHSWDAVALVEDYGMMPFTPNIVKPTAGTFSQAVADLRLETARSKRKNGGIHVL